MRRQKRLGYFFTLVLAAVLAIGTIGTHSSASAQTFAITPPSPGCQLLSAPAGTTAAFCDTFDKPEGIGDRSGALNGTVWGVSRMLGGINTGQRQYFDVSPTAIELCGTTYSVIDPNDVQICGGQLVEAHFDQTGVTSLAMYPKQPFDISGGRTGTIAFDVSNDSHGTHSVWPELWYVDTPVPTPFVHDTSLISVPANGFGVQFAGTCPANSGAGCGARGFCPEYSESVPVVTISAAWVVKNYMETEVDAFQSTAPGTFTVTPVECVQASSGPGNMNHFELRVSQNEIDVYGIDAGATGPLKKIGVISNAGLTITTGLVFMEDDHYNANKDSNGQGVHTFTWDNFAFDGPVLPRDLAFDVLDGLTPVGPGYPGLLNAGWGFGGFDQSPTPPPLTLIVPGVYNVADAAAALLTFNFVDFNYANLSAPEPFISYSVNNGATQLAPFPFGACGVQNGGPACSSEYTISVPVNLSDVVTGTNTIALTATDGAAIANVDLILHSAGGIPCTTSCPAALPSPTVTITPSASSITNAQGLTVAVNVAGSGSQVPTGTVTLSEVGYRSAPITLSSGKATISIPAGSLPAGPDLLTVSYSGDSNYAFTSNNSSVSVSSVEPVAGNVSLIFSPSAFPSITTAQPLQLVVDLFGSGFLAPIVVTGSVTVTGGGYNSGAVPLGAGLATINIPAGALAVGNDTFAVNYSGDSNYAAEDFTDLLTITVNGTSLPTITSFVASPTNITAGASSSLTGVFSHGAGMITPGNISVTSGAGVSVSPTATTTYTLTVTPTTGTAVTQTATVTVQPATKPVPAALISPAPGSLLGSNATFTWSAGTGVSQYALWLSTTNGSSNLYNSGHITTTSAAVTGLLMNGATVYAELWSYMNGGWQFTLYTFAEGVGGATPVPAALISPAPGSVLGSNATFTWSAGSGVSQYAIWLSTTNGSSNLYNSGHITTTSAAVTGLPMNGATVYAELWSYMNGGWQFTLYTFTEGVGGATSVPAALISPAPGSVLGSSATFTWSAGSGVSQYALWLSTTSGSSNLYNSGHTTATSAAVTGLPTNGATIFAQLWSYMDGGWQFTVYTFKEGVPVPAAVIRPHATMGQKQF
jgi:hypothetical protein